MRWQYFFYQIPITVNSPSIKKLELVHATQSMDLLDPNSDKWHINIELPENAKINQFTICRYTRSPHYMYVKFFQNDTLVCNYEKHTNLNLLNNEMSRINKLVYNNVDIIVGTCDRYIMIEYSYTVTFYE